MNTNKIAICQTKKSLYTRIGLLVVACISITIFATGSHAAGLESMVSGSNTLILSLARLLNTIAALVGGWFVFSGVMAWKKSSNEHGGAGIEFKSVVIPIVAGVILVCFTTFIMLTSHTFGFASPNTMMYQ